MIKKREDRKRKISQEQAALLPKSRGIINLKTRMKDGDTGIFMQGDNYNCTGGGGVKDMVRKFESLEGQSRSSASRLAKNTTLVTPSGDRRLTLAWRAHLRGKSLQS